MFVLIVFASDVVDFVQRTWRAAIHHVLGNGHKAKLRFCRTPGMTSLLLPDQNVLSAFREIRDLNLLKIDVQGSELAVFGSGRQKLKQAVAVQTEVSFLCLYKEQPTFGDIDGELRKQGFVPHAFTAINRRMIAPLSDRSASTWRLSRRLPRRP